MKSILNFAALAGALCIAGAAVSASAQTNTVTQTVTGNTMVGSASGTPACPSVHWTLVRQYAAPAKSGPLAGVVFYNDGSGMSRMTGASQADGTFKLNLTSVDGKGPTGTIVGARKPNGELTADMMSATGDCKYSTPVVVLETGAGPAG